MVGRKWISLALILIGIALIAYPVGLTIQSKWQQMNMIKELKQDDQQKAAYPDNRTTEQTTTAQEVQVTPKQTGEVGQLKPELLLDIPKISLEVAVVKVKDLSVYQRQISFPPGLYPQSAAPGAVGNVAIAGHVNGPAGYFAHLNRLVKGDEITLTTPAKTYHYKVESVWVTDPTDWKVVEATDYPALTLTTCQSDGVVRNAKRLIVRARLTNN